MEEMLELSKREWKVPVINVLRALKYKADNMQEHIDNVSREMERWKLLKKTKPHSYINKECL
jgi:endonuclease V-like protein UPF0215 family